MSVQLEGLAFLFPVRATYRTGEQTKTVFAYVDATNQTVWIPGCEEQPEYDDLVRLIGDKCLGMGKVPRPAVNIDLAKYNDFKAVIPQKRV